MSQHVVRVKVCGLTRVSDAVACVRAGIDWIGLNFHPGSPRFIEPTMAAEIMAALPEAVEAVGVFVDRPPIEVARVARSLGLRIVQLHGNEPPEDLLALGGLHVVRAFGLGGRSAWNDVIEYLARARTLGRLPDAVLIDASVAGKTGGTGTAIADEILDAVPPLPDLRLILAGGLNASNVAARVARVRPWMVDVASGVESEPGCKDPAELAAFVKAARSAVLDQ